MFDRHPPIILWSFAKGPASHDQKDFAPVDPPFVRADHSLFLPAAQKKKSFEAWLAEFKTEAAAKGISQATLQSALSKVQYLPKVIELQKNQPEFKFTVEEYLIRVASEARVLRGREVLAEQRLTA